MALKQIAKGLWGDAKMVSHSARGKILTGSNGYMEDNYISSKDISNVKIAVGTIAVGSGVFMGRELLNRKTRKKRK